MGRRQDGRIEPGQKLSKAISARAWNRAQDAADIVLGDSLAIQASPGKGITGSLVVACRVTTSIASVKPGHVVAINTAGAYAIPDPSEALDKKSPRVFSFEADVVTPVEYISYGQSLRPFGVIVGGVAMPQIGQPRVVNVCITGMCVARVKMRGVGDFLRRPVIREEQDTIESLTGLAEQSSCGPHRIVEEIGPADPGDETVKYCAVIL